MLYSVIICIAYIIGIIWGLYLDFYLSIVSFFLFICVGLMFLKERKILILISACFIIGMININYRRNDFENKYTARCLLWKR